MATSNTITNSWMIMPLFTNNMWEGYFNWRSCRVVMCVQLHLVSIALYQTSRRASCAFHTTNIYFFYYCRWIYRFSATINRVFTSVDLLLAESCNWLHNMLIFKTVWTWLLITVHVETIQWPSRSVFDISQETSCMFSVWLLIVCNCRGC